MKIEKIFEFSVFLRGLVSPFYQKLMIRLQKDYQKFWK